MTDIDNSQDIMDSRDVIARLEELQDEQDSLIEEYTKAKAEADDLEEGAEWEPTERLTNAINALSTHWDIMPEDVDSAVEGPFMGLTELTDLRAFADQLEGYGDWEQRETLIRESYFTEYCQDLLKEWGDLPDEIPHYIVIDWEATANNLRIDYTEGTLDGVTYLMRA